MAFFLHLHDTLVPSTRNSYRPHALSQKSFSLFSGLLLSAKLLTVFSVNAAAPIGQAYSAAVTPANIIQLTNASRQGYGLSNLTENTQLDAAAQAKADDMLQKQYFAHTSPAGKTPWDFIANSGYNYIIAGENLALNFFSAESTEQAWMNSPDHRANILNGNFENIGVGVSQGEYNGVAAIFVVQEFGTPLPQSYTIQQPSAQPASNVSDVASVVASAPSVPPIVPVSQAVAATTAAQSQVLSAQVNPLPMDGGSSLAYQIVVHTMPTVATVNASYGNEGVMLQPTAVAGVWQATIPASQLAQTQLVVHAYDMAGNVSSTQQISFSSDIGDNFAFQAALPQTTVSILGKSIPIAVLDDLYIGFALIMMVLIGIFIASRVPVADVGMVAQTAGLIALAVIFWVH